MGNGRDRLSAGIHAGSGLGLGDDWRRALGEALDGALLPLAGETPDVVVLFPSAV